MSSTIDPATEPMPPAVAGAGAAGAAETAGAPTEVAGSIVVLIGHASRPCRTAFRGAPHFGCAIRR